MEEYFVNLDKLKEFLYVEFAFLKKQEKIFLESRNQKRMNLILFSKNSESKRRNTLRSNIDKVGIR